LQSQVQPTTRGSGTGHPAIILTLALEDQVSVRCPDMTDESSYSQSQSCFSLRTTRMRSARQPPQCAAVTRFQRVPSCLLRFLPPFSPLVHPECPPMPPEQMEPPDGESFEMTGPRGLLALKVTVSTAPMLCAFMLSSVCIQRLHQGRKLHRYVRVNNGDESLILSASSATKLYSRLSEIQWTTKECITVL
jgi:hypothetical protein